MLLTKTKNFEGPLDLLLTLIEQRQLDITQIALAEVTEQFLQHIKTLENVDPTSLADYLAIAAKLLVIKSRAILPTLELETDNDEDAAPDLESRLQLYKQFKEAAKHLHKLDLLQKQGWGRYVSFEERINFYPDQEITSATLKNAILKILAELKELDSLPKAKVKEAISIQDKINQLQENLSHQLEINLSHILSQAKNKDEVIVTFLALLELIKQKIFIAQQDALFAEVVIKKIPKI